MSLIKINTRDFSEVEISDDMIMKFPEGVFAFEEYKEFVLLSPLGEDKFPMWLQSVNEESLCFIVFDPKEFCPDYAVTLTDEAKTALGYSQGDVIEYLAITVIPDEYRNATINLKSPVVINNSQKTAVQMIAQEAYPIRFPIFTKEEN